MPVHLVKSKHVVTGVLLQALETFGYNLQRSDLDSNGPDGSVQTITISQYPFEKVNMGYPGSAVDYEPSDQTSLDTWSVVWYIASFAGLILFFLIVSCSEWCCRRNARRNCQRNSNSQSPPQAVPDTPPPSYDQFAPPSYEDLLGGSSRSRRGEKTEYDIYVVPVHALDESITSPLMAPDTIEGSHHVHDHSLSKFQGERERPISHAHLSLESLNSGILYPPRPFRTLMEEARRVDAPPPYHQSTNAGTAHPQELPRVHSVDNTSRVT